MIAFRKFSLICRSYDYFFVLSFLTNKQDSYLLGFWLSFCHLVLLVVVCVLVVNFHPWNYVYMYIILYKTLNLLNDDLTLQNLHVY